MGISQGGDCATNYVRAHRYITAWTGNSCWGNSVNGRKRQWARSVGHGSVVRCTNLENAAPTPGAPAVPTPGAPNAAVPTPAPVPTPPPTPAPPFVGVWVRGKQGQNCATTCGSIEFCDERYWPNSLETFKKVLTKMGDDSCTSFDSGDWNVNPGIYVDYDNTCFWQAGEPGAPRCSYSHYAVARLCPCKGPPPTTAPAPTTTLAVTPPPGTEAPPSSRRRRGNRRRRRRRRKSIKKSDIRSSRRRRGNQRRRRRRRSST